MRTRYEGPLKQGEVGRGQVREVREEGEAGRGVRWGG